MTYTMGGAYVRTPPSIFKHMLDQQNTNPPSIGSWMQLPQVPPITAPWNVSTSQQPETVRFTTESNYTSTNPMQLHQKRKRDSIIDPVDAYQTKQFISEEKMAAHFKDLHISSKHRSKSPVPSTSKVDTSFCQRLNMDLDLDPDLDVNTKDTQKTETDNTHPRLVFSEELKRIKPIFPSTLLSQLERPSMALVLWEPPTKHLRIIPTRDIPTPMPGISDDNNNNNSDIVPDLNYLLSDSVSSTLEPMEL